MKSFKGFNHKLKCRDFQYEIGKTYEQKGEIKVCKNGFHVINEDISPLAVFMYYPPAYEQGKLSRYCEVEAEGKIDKNITKIACSKITIGNEIGITGLIKAHVEWVKSKTGNRSIATNTGGYSAATNTSSRSIATNTGKHSAATNTGNCSAATNTGDCSASTNTGGYSAATNTGDCSASTNTGGYSAATNTGFCSAATNTGKYSAATNTGKYSAATNTGDCSAAMNTGDCSAAMNTGNQSTVCVEGKDSVAIATGFEGKAKGALGCAIVVAERDDYDGETYPLKAICSAIVDGVNIKADTWYTVKNGKFVEVEN